LRYERAMSGGASIWLVDVEDPSAVRAKLGAWRDVEEERPGVLRVTNDAEAPHQLLADLSRELVAHAIWMAAETVTDSFEYVHYQAGAPVRVLTLGAVDQGVWDRVEGTPQPWEAWDNAPAPGEEDMIDAGATAELVFKHFRLMGHEPAAPKKKTKTKTKKRQTAGKRGTKRR
jgi:hypothetical protein